MADLIFVAITIAFFALSVGYVHVCDRIIGPDSPQSESPDEADTDELVAAADR